MEVLRMKAWIWWAVGAAALLALVLAAGRLVLAMLVLD
jgi:hypothetical protein